MAGVVGPNDPIPTSITAGSDPTGVMRAVDAAAAPGGGARPSRPRIGNVQCTSSRIVPGTDFMEREYTMYLLVSSTEAADGAPKETVQVERRFSEVVKFHDEFVKPLMSLDRPVLLPSDMNPVDYVNKNDSSVISERRIALQYWANGCVQMSIRLGSPVFDFALQHFLRGGNTDACPLPSPAVWDPAGEWTFNTQVTFTGTTYTVPHTLQLSPDGTHVFFNVGDHPLGQGCVCRGSGTWETVENGLAVRVTLTLEATNTPEGAAGGTGAPAPAPILEEMPPTSAQTAAAAAAAEAAAGSAGTKGGAQAGKLATTTTECVMLLRKSFRPLAKSWADFKNSPSKFGAIVDRVDTLMNDVWYEGWNNQPAEQRRLVCAHCTMAGREVPTSSSAVRHTRTHTQRKPHILPPMAAASSEPIPRPFVCSTVCCDDCLSSCLLTVPRLACMTIDC
jgi:hypothetical protein